MLLERAEIQVKAGSEEAFAAVMAERGLPLLRAVPGVKSAKLGRGVENPAKFMFLVEWDAMEAHAAFNQSAVHPEFLGLFAPYAEGGAMEHFQFS
jgi:heme-degrading monooxygenase HmoA